MVLLDGGGLWRRLVGEDMEEETKRMAAGPERQISAAVTVVKVLAAASFANGLWMLVAPLHWYHRIPAGIPDYGPFNAHFVRDIGSAYLTVGAALACVAVRGSARFELTSMAAFFAVVHAVVHVFDTACGHVGVTHWLLDLPWVYFPAIALVWAAWVFHEGRPHG